MTRKEAIKILDQLKPTNVKDTFGAYVIGEALTMAIEALKRDKGEWIDKQFDEQEPKTGHWIYTPIKRLIDDEEGRYITDYRCSCSKCGSDFGFQKMSDAYCKYCGSRMVEPQESENKE